MMVNIEEWLPRWRCAVEEVFGQRIRLLGLQGSYRRGEAVEGSDIDVVLILDKVEMADLKRYRAVLDGLPHREKICGFVGGAEELRHWEPADLFQFREDTQPLSGDLDSLLPPFCPGDVKRAVWTGACGIYHLCGREFLHQNEPEGRTATLRSLYKSVVFVMQALGMDRTGQYCRRREELRQTLTAEEGLLLVIAEQLKGGTELTEQEEEAAFSRLLQWSGQLIRSYGV